MTGLQAVAGTVLSVLSLWLAYRIYRGGGVRPGRLALCELAALVLLLAVGFLRGAGVL